MTDSQFLYQTMNRTHAMRASALAAVTPKMEDLLNTIGRLCVAVEDTKHDVSDTRDLCVELAAHSLRLAVERIGHA